MKLKIQPWNSSTCGHHCVAMITHKRVSGIIKRIGHENGTYTRELVRVLRDLGYECPDRLIRFKAFEDPLPRRCIVKYRFGDRKYGHWVVVFKGMVYDPGMGIYPFCREALLEMGARATSYLPVARGIGQWGSTNHMRKGPGSSRGIRHLKIKKEQKKDRG